MVYVIVVGSYRHVERVMSSNEAMCVREFVRARTPKKRLKAEHCILLQVRYQELLPVVAIL